MSILQAPLIVALLFLLSCSDKARSRYTDVNEQAASQILNNLENVVKLELQANAEAALNIINDINEEIAKGRADISKIPDTVIIAREDTRKLLKQIAKKESFLEKLSAEEPTEMGSILRTYWFGHQSSSGEAKKLRLEFQEYFSRLSALINYQFVGDVTFESEERLMKASCNCIWDEDGAWEKQFFSDNLLSNQVSLKTLELSILRSERILLSILKCRVNLSC